MTLLRFQTKLETAEKKTKTILLAKIGRKFRISNEIKIHIYKAIISSNSFEHIE